MAPPTRWGETPSEMVAVAREGVTTASRSTPLEAESIDCGPPSGEADSHRYSDTIKAVFAYNPNITPQPLPVDDVFGGELMALCRRCSGRSGILPFPAPGCSRALCGLLGGDGVSQSPVVEAGHAREGAQRWGTYMSLTCPPLRQFKAEYYRIHYPAEVSQPQQLWTTSSFLAITQWAPPTEFRIRNSVKGLGGVGESQSGGGSEQAAPFPCGCKAGCEGSCCPPPLQIVLYCILIIMYFVICCCWK